MTVLSPPDLGTYPILSFEETDCEEPLGSKEKGWARFEGAHWLFKYPRANGEHWAEKLAAEVAKLLGLSAATVELARLKGEPGVASRDILNKGESLIHGNEILAYSVENYQLDKKWKQRDHQLDNIWEAIELRVYFVEDAKVQFCGYLVLDALIGNTDRHHENWAFARDALGCYRLAPSYDHGSSLGRELKDLTRKKNCRQAILEEKRMSQYLRRARGSIYWKEEPKALSPLELVGQAWQDARYRPYLEPWLGRLDEDLHDGVERAVAAVPEYWMGALSRVFVKEMVRQSSHELKEMCR